VRLISKLSALIGAIILLSSFQWPVENFEFGSGFAQNRFGGFSPGVTLRAKGESISPVGSGEIVFALRENEKPYTIPSGLGSFCVIDHERNLRSLYSHLLDIPKLDNGGEMVSPETVLGTVGGSGFAMGETLFLMLYDMEVNQLVNPLLLLPERKDDTKPVIGGLYLKNIDESEEIQLIRSGMTVDAGQKILLAGMYDPVSGAVTMKRVPYEISAYVNGEEVSRRILEGLSEDDCCLTLVDQKEGKFEQIYHNSGRVRLGTVTVRPGTANIEVVARDFAGNRGVFRTSITVTGGE